MQTITTEEAVAQMPRLLADVEKGEEFLITRAREPIARLVPLRTAITGPRPKVGETLGPSFAIPDDAFAPLTAEELKHWGL